MNVKHLLLAAALLVTVVAQAGELKLRSVYSDHMLFQRDKPIVLLGRADADAEVSASMGGKSAAAKAGADGRFRVELPAMSAGGPNEVVVASGTNTVTLKDVLVGELWLCSGQSNMEMPVWGNNEFYRLTNGLEVAAQAADNDLRLLLVPRTDGKAGRCENPNDWDQWKHWERATPDSVKNFSATGYMFGKYLRKRLGIPVGLVNASWGGSRIEPWIPKRGSEVEPEHYNGMIAPLEGFRFRGVVWYQGCANAREWYSYDALQRRLVARWRQELDLPDLNFICVQLAGYLAHQPQTPHTAAQLAALKPTEDGFTFMRPAQAMIRAVEGCDSVTAFDLGMASDIHPKNKDEVGRRLAAAAANLCYGAQEPVRGPKPVAFARDGDAVLVTFDGPLAVKGGAIGPHEFTLKPRGGERVWAEAKLVKPDTVRVYSPAVKNPLRVDYGWMPFMEKTSLYNDKGFPVEPFCRYVVEPDPQAKPVFIAHRGESVDAPENTLPAYKTAVERGFGFECDVYLSKDKRVFTFHDSNLNRTTGGANKSNCADVSWAETLQYVDVGNWGKWKDSKFKGTRPALLEEVLALARDGKQIYVEVKTGPEIIPYIKQVIAKQDQATPKNMLFITFNEKTCAALKEAMPQFKAYLLLCAQRSRDLGPAAPISAREMILQAKTCHADGIDLQYVSKIHTADFIAEIRDAGLELHVWTVDDVAKSVEATARGAQSVTTNCARKQQEEINVVGSPSGELNLRDAAAMEPIRPGGVNGSPFWNRYGRMFMYPPAFDFKPVDGAVKYRFLIHDREHQCLMYEADRPTAALTPVWAQIPAGFVAVWCQAVLANGQTVVTRGDWESDYRLFWKQASFKPGAYPKPTRSYGDAAEKFLTWIFDGNETAFRHFRETGDPHGEWPVGIPINCYPAKIHSALIRAGVDFATRCPSRRDEAMQLARVAAEYLQKVSCGPNEPCAGFPPTYEGTSRVCTEYAGQVMMIYPSDAGKAYLALAKATGERRWTEAAQLIGETYLKLQEADGTWPLKVWAKTGKASLPNRLQPLAVVDFLEQLFAATGDARYRAAADRAFAWVERGPMRDWNWEAQYEDATPSPVPYFNMAGIVACQAVEHVLKRYPNDKKRLAFCREAMRFVEDQFICWEVPCDANGFGACTLDKLPTNPPYEYRSWTPPCVLEQSTYAVPVSAAAGIVIGAYLSLHAATGDDGDLARARAIGDALVCAQRANGAIPDVIATPYYQCWLNDAYTAVEGLRRLAEVSDQDGIVRSVSAAAKRIGDGTNATPGFATFRFAPRLIDALAALFADEALKILSVVFSPCAPERIRAAFGMCRTMAKSDGVVRAYRRGGPSPALDAGDPNSDYAREFSSFGFGDGGKRVNLGFYGNTPWATLSPIPGSFMTVR